jgi:hypothetical protein
MTKGPADCGQHTQAFPVLHVYLPKGYLVYAPFSLEKATALILLKLFALSVRPLWQRIAFFVGWAAWLMY